MPRKAPAHAHADLFPLDTIYGIAGDKAQRAALLTVSVDTRAPRYSALWHRIAQRLRLYVPVLVVVHVLVMAASVVLMQIWS